MVKEGNFLDYFCVFNLQKSLEIQFAGHIFECLPQKALYWKAKKYLIISDLHLGKAAHLRKNGFAINEKAQLKDFALLNAIFKQKQIEHVYVLGDLFHSKTLADIDLLMQCIMLSKANWHLVRGNHDVFNNQTYYSLGFKSVCKNL